MVCVNQIDTDHDKKDQVKSCPQDTPACFDYHAGTTSYRGHYDSCVLTSGCKDCCSADYNQDVVCCDQIDTDHDKKDQVKPCPQDTTISVDYHAGTTSYGGHYGSCVWSYPDM